MSKKNDSKPTQPELEVVKCAARVAVSLVAIAAGVCLMFLSPEYKQWGTGLVSFVAGYWLH